jgi:hypothetical protein
MAARAHLLAFTPRPDCAMVPARHCITNGFQDTGCTLHSAHECMACQARVHLHAVHACGAGRGALVRGWLWRGVHGAHVCYTKERRAHKRNSARQKHAKARKTGATEPKHKDSQPEQQSKPKSSTIRHKHNTRRTVHRAAHPPTDTRPGTRRRHRLAMSCCPLWASALSCPCVIVEVRQNVPSRPPGLEPGSSAWKANILPLNYGLVTPGNPRSELCLHVFLIGNVGYKMCKWPMTPRLGLRIR